MRRLEPKSSFDEAPLVAGRLDPAAFACTDGLEEASSHFHVHGGSRLCGKLGSSIPCACPVKVDPLPPSVHRNFYSVPISSFLTVHFL